MAIRNEIKMSFTSNSENVGIARITAASFAAQVEFTLSDIEEIKVAVSEAVSNAIIHGYGDNTTEKICFTMTLSDEGIEFVVIDYGKGIADVNIARQPSYSSDSERMGLGFVFMESFMDELDVQSSLGSGTIVKMTKKYKSIAAH